MTQSRDTVPLQVLIEVELDRMRQASLAWQHAHDEMHTRQAAASETRRHEGQDAAETRRLEWRAGHLLTHTMEQQALAVATRALDKRLEGQNEFRAQLQTQAATFATSVIVDTRLTALQERMEAADSNLAERREALASSLDARLTAVERTLAATAGRAGGASQTVVWLFAGIAALGGGLGLITAFLNLIKR